MANSAGRSRLEVAVVPEPALDPDTLRRFAAGDESAFSAVYRRYARPMFTVALQVVGKHEPASGLPEQAPEQRQPSPRRRAQVHLVAAVHARQQRGGAALLRRRPPCSPVQVAEGDAPPEHVTAAIAARHPPVPPDAQEDAAPRLQELVGDLAPRGARPDHQHRPIGERPRMPVLAGVKLGQPRRQLLLG